MNKIAKSEDEQFLLICPCCGKDFFAYFVSAWVKATVKKNVYAAEPWVEYRRIECIEPTPETKAGGSSL